MFLIERLIGTTIYAFFMILFVVLISKSKNIKSTKKILIVYLIILFFMGYFYLPYKTADLYYIKNLIKTSYVDLSFQDIMLALQRSRFSIYKFYYWIFGKIGNLNLLPAITALIFYYNVFYILYKSAIKFNWSSKTMSKTLLFFMAGGQFLEVISGIKSLLAFSIVAVCCYREFVENKSFLSDIILYIIAALLHDAAFVLVGFRLGYLLLQKEDKAILKVRNILFFIIFITVVLLKFQNILQGVFDHGSGYVNGNVYSNIWEYIIAILCNVFMIYSIFLCKKCLKKKNDLNLRRVYLFTKLLLIVDLIFITEYSTFQRYRTFIMIIIIPIIGYLFEKSKDKEYEFLKKYTTNFTYFCIVTNVFALIRGNLSSLKFFELK